MARLFDRCQPDHKIECSFQAVSPAFCRTAKQRQSVEGVLRATTECGRFTASDDRVWKVYCKRQKLVWRPGNDAIKYYYLLAVELGTFTKNLYLLQSKH